MKFSRQVVLMNDVASHCFVSFAFANTFGLQVKKGSSTLVLGNDDQVPTGGHVKVHVKIQKYHSQINCLGSKLSDGIDMILCMFIKAVIK